MSHFRFLPGFCCVICTSAPLEFWCLYSVKPDFYTYKTLISDNLKIKIIFYLVVEGVFILCYDLENKAIVFSRCRQCIYCLI